jgi:Tfp pilus assembly protein PilW
MRGNATYPLVRPRGLSVAEACISLAVCALLLVGVAAAFTASTDAVKVNDQFFRATQAGRVTLGQLLAEIRRADTVEVTPDNLKVLIIRPALSRSPNETYREYRYDPQGKRVTVQIFYAEPAPQLSSPVYTLARNIESASFGPPYRDNTTLAVLRVPVALRVKIGENVVLVSDASSPRKLMKK